MQLHYNCLTISKLLHGYFYPSSYSPSNTTYAIHHCHYPIGCLLEHTDCALGLCMVFCTRDGHFFKPCTTTRNAAWSVSCNRSNGIGSGSNNSPCQHISVPVFCNLGTVSFLVMNNSTGSSIQSHLNVAKNFSKVAAAPLVWCC